jgi:hypothetical protein
MGRKKKPESEKVSKPGVSLTPECREILRRVLDYELNVHRNQFNYSKIVQKCLRLAWEKHYEPLCVQFERDSDVAMFSEGNIRPRLTLGGDVIEPPETLDSGSSPRKKIKYQTKRQANSSK